MRDEVVGVLEFAVLVVTVDTKWAQRHAWYGNSKVIQQTLDTQHTHYNKRSEIRTEIDLLLQAWMPSIHV